VEIRQKNQIFTDTYKSFQRVPSEQLQNERKTLRRAGLGANRRVARSVTDGQRFPRAEPRTGGGEGSLGRLSSPPPSFFKYIPAEQSDIRVLPARVQSRISVIHKPQVVPEGSGGQYRVRICIIYRLYILILVTDRK
jgi:hypothetical protein